MSYEDFYIAGFYFPLYAIFLAYIVYWLYLVDPLYSDEKRRVKYDGGGTPPHASFLVIFDLDGVPPLPSSRSDMSINFLAAF